MNFVRGVTRVVKRWVYWHVRDTYCVCLKSCEYGGSIFLQNVCAHFTVHKVQNMQAWVVYLHIVMGAEYSCDINLVSVAKSCELSMNSRFDTIS